MTRLVIESHRGEGVVNLCVKPPDHGRVAEIVLTIEAAADLARSLVRAIDNAKDDPRLMYRKEFTGNP